MKILLIAREMITITGSPMYNYTLAIELKRQGHEVDIYSLFSNNDTRKDLLKNGIGLLVNTPTKSYNLCLISQVKFEKILDFIRVDKVYNIIHSEYEYEKPIINNKIDGYIAIRESIKDKLISHYRIKKPIFIIYNGIDFNRFNESKRKKHNGKYVKVVLPCTIDSLRLKMIRHYISMANENFRVYIYGTNHINLQVDNKWVFFNENKFDIENYICDADIIAGILLGRVNLEAHAMGIKNVIHNPETNEMTEFKLTKKEFDKRHNIKNVAKDILNLIGNTNETKRVFENIIDNNLWQGSESVSGTGSDLVQTFEIRKELPRIFRQYDIKSMLDIPCGDFYWMSEVNLGTVKYIGADIVPSLIQKNREKCNNIFKVMDLIESPLPKVDLIFCRDCLVHLSFSEILKAIKNCKASGSKYLLTTSFPNHGNIDIKTGGWRPLNLEVSPFGFNPIDCINENCTENKGIYKDKSLLLFDLECIQL